MNSNIKSTLSILAISSIISGCGGGNNNTPLISEISTPKICKTVGDTVLIPEGEKCEYEGHNLTCKNNWVTMDDSINSKLINLNGIKYTCE